MYFYILLLFDAKEYYSVKYKETFYGYVGITKCLQRVKRISV